MGDAIEPTERTAREEAQILKGILAASVDHIYVVDREGRYRHVSAGAAQVLGFAPEAVIGKHWRELGLSADVMERFDLLRERVLQSGANAVEEATFRTHEGEERCFEYIVSPILSQTGEPDAVVVVSRDVTQRHQAEAALRRTQSLLDAVIDYAPACIFAKDRDGRYLLANRALAELVGREQSEFPGRTDYDFFPPEVAAQFGEDDAVIIAEGQPRVYHESFVQDGVRRTYLTVKFPLRDESGVAFAACAVATDITDLKRAQEALRVSEERLRLALEAARMGVWDWDLERNTIQWSEGLEPLFGLAPGAFGGTPEAFLELVFPDDRDAVRRSLTQAVEERSRFDTEYRIRRPDGSVHWMAGKGKTSPGNDAPTRMVGVAMDVTDRKRAEQNARFLADASAALAGLVDYASTLQMVARLAVPTFADWCAVDMLDESGALRRLAVAHVDPSKVELAHELHRRYPPNPNVPRGVWNILRTGQSEITSEITDDLLAASISDPELLQIMRDLGLRSYMAVPLSVRGRVLGVLTFIAAESGRRYSADDLRMAEDLAHRAAIAIENARLYGALREADQRKDEFLALLGHELRNPLAPIRNALGILRLPGADPAVAGRARETMERQVEHLVRLVDDLLDVSRIMRGQVELRRERIDLATVVARAVETSQPAITAEGHALEINLAPEPLWVNGDLVRLAQVVSNLLNNAAKYTDRGGRIRVSLARDGHEGVLRVQDTGIGIPAELLPRLFDMFFQVERRTRQSQGGLGIGLSLVRGLVELHGGSVEALSAGPGRGSEFVIRLPLLGLGSEVQSPTSSGAGPAPGDLEPGRLGPRRKVLVVDDNVDAADTLAMLLELNGQEVRVAYDGRSALAQAEADPPRVAFLDLGMPHMDGYELARAFRAHPALRDVKLIALTGWGQPEDRQRTREAGFDYHLVKPVETTALDRLLADAE